MILVELKNCVVCLVKCMDSIVLIVKFGVINIDVLGFVMSYDLIC